jgi:hypothetical protein
MLLYYQRACESVHFPGMARDNLAQKGGGLSLLRHAGFQYTSSASPMLFCWQGNAARGVTFFFFFLSPLIGFISHDACPTRLFFFKSNKIKKVFFIFFR